MKGRSLKRKVAKGGLSLTCGLGRPSKAATYEVKCSIDCRNGWRARNGDTSTTCNSNYVQHLRENPGIRKMTNFTLDYLECERSGVKEHIMP